MRIGFVHYPGRLARLEAIREGRSPTEFLFGAIELERRGVEVAHYEVDPHGSVGRLGGLLNRYVYLGYLPAHLGGTELRQTRQLLRALDAYDVIVATTPDTALPLAVWRRLGLLRPPLVGIVSGLANPDQRPLRKKATVLLLAAMHSLLYGEGELEAMLALDPRLAGRVEVNQFGIDTDFWTPTTAPNDGYVLAIGNNGHRDYETLIEAAPSIGAPLRVFTNAPPPAALPDNVEWCAADWHRQILSDEDVRDLYRAAAVVVVPLKDTIQPSGQSVTLQALACAKPVVLTRTRGLWSKATIDNETAALVPPSSPHALAETVRKLLATPELRDRLGTTGRRRVCEHATVEHTAERILRASRRLAT